MGQNNFKSEPGGRDLVTETLLKKYGLLNKHEEMVEALIKSGDPEELIKIFRDSPGAKLAKLINDYSEGKISEESAPVYIESELEISKDNVRGFLEDLNYMVGHTSNNTIEEKIPPIEDDKKIEKEEKEFKSLKDDSYREQIKE